MKLKELEDEFRRLTDDVKAPLLWSHDEIVTYANEAEIDATDRGLLIEDDATATICRIPISATKHSYVLSPLVLRITRARLDSRSAALNETDADTLDRVYPQWEVTTGTPHSFIERPSKVRLVWTPVVADVLRMTVKRLPIKPMVNPDDGPEIAPQYHYRLLDGMLMLAYKKHDSQTYDPKLSQQHEAAFTRSFGERQDANVRRKQRAHRPHRTKPGPYA